MAELFLVHVVLFVAVTVCFQTANRLDVPRSQRRSATVTIGGSIPTTPPAAAVAATTTLRISERDDDDDGDCIYVPGGGFSGFWFSLGRLQSLEHPHTERFVCYSAGCLGVVSVLWNNFERNNNHSNSNTNTNTNDTNMNNDNNRHHRHHYERLYENARSVQAEWQDGHTHRYRVVETFIDGLLDPLEKADESASEAFLEILRRTVFIVTTVFDDDHEHDGSGSRPSYSSLIPKATLRQPHDVPSLKRMLLQTSWIPLATGSSWTHKGHMDGAFSMAQHPECHKTVGLDTAAFAVAASTTTTTSEDHHHHRHASNLSSWYDSVERSSILWTNTLNVNLRKTDVDRLWSTGLEYGV